MIPATVMNETPSSSLRFYAPLPTSTFFGTHDKFTMYFLVVNSDVYPCFRCGKFELLCDGMINVSPICTMQVGQTIILFSGIERIAGVYSWVLCSIQRCSARVMG